MVDMSDLHAVAHAALDVAGLERLRAHFPVLAQEINGAPLAYLDNAATTQSPLSVQDAVRHFEQHDRANIHRGVHTLSQRATDAFEQARQRASETVEGHRPGRSRATRPRPFFVASTSSWS